MDSQVFAMRGLVDGDCAWGGHERYAFVRELAERYPHLRKVLEKVTTVLQVRMVRVLVRVLACCR